MGVVQNFKAMKYAVIFFILINVLLHSAVLQGLALPAHHWSMAVLIRHIKESLQHLLPTMNIKRMLNF